ncbi:MAG: YdcF family protein [Muribaculaceae bacterium]|nr:YdcF family protein [Muribaculaceae bacterium]
MKIKPKKKRLLIASAVILGCVLVIIIACNIVVYNFTLTRTFDDVNDVPHNKYGILLATSPITPLGVHNYYFDYRIRAVDELYKAGKIDYIIASGGDYTSSHKYGCDEPQAILDSLVARGVTPDKIILDYGGTRTIHSIVYAKEQNIDSVTFISQKDHNERAIYLADAYGIEAIGYNAPTPPARRSKIRNTVREYFARVKMFIDLYILERI